MEEKWLLNEYYLIYKDLLTEKQREYFEAYALNDLSLSEVAENMNVSRNAVYNMINLVSDALNKYESKLKLYYKKNKIIEILDNNENVKEEIMKLL